ncbi:MAG: phosphate--acyl-ACP acyltransferase, partial [Bacteroidetes bacterium]
HTYFLQFAVLASIYAKNMYGVAQPKVALLNLGEEEGKGNALAQATYPLLQQNTQLQFVGNVEGRDFFNDKADVIVCDGFTGNVILKLAETLYEVAEARGVADDAYFKRFHYEEYGGTPILGINKPVIIGHGISSARAFTNMLQEAGKMVETALIDQLKQAFV